MSKQLETIKNSESSENVDDIFILEPIKNLVGYFDTERFLAFRRALVTWIMGNDPIVMNITVTSDIVEYNKLDTNERAIFAGNMVKKVSDKTSFVYNPNATTNTK